MSRKISGNLLLLLTAMIWGCAFVAQSSAMDNIGPWTFTCIRSYIGAFVLFVLMPVIDRIRGITKEASGDRKTLVKGGIACGAALMAASMFQQTGIMYTTAGKAGFLTALYVIIVPFLSVLLGRKIPGHIWISAAAAVAGFYFLSMSGGLTIGYGDILVLICALLFAVHIMIIDHFVPYTDGVRMSAIQFLTCAVLCTLPMLIFEKPALSSIISAAGPVIYAGAVSSGAGYTLQILGQKDADPSVASLLLSLESVFAAVFGFLLLHEAMSLREMTGCILIFGAIIYAQLAGGKKENKE